MTRFVAVFVVSLLSTIGFAQAGLEDFCRTFLTINVRDEANLFTTSQSFDLVRTILAEQNELDYSTAQTLQAEAQIPILDVIDLTLSGETTEENWVSRRDTFFNDMLNANTASQEVRSQVSRITNAFFGTADRCIDALARAAQNQEAFFPVVTVLSHTQFEVAVTYRINPNNPRPLTIDFNTGPIEIDYNPSVPYTFTAANQTRSFRCAKPEEEPIFLTVTADSLDDRGAFDLPGGGEIAILRRDVDELRARLAGLSPIARGTIGAFNLATCPSGWSTFSAGVGRTIVGVGSGADLTPRTLIQQGGEEAHTLTIPEMPSHDHGGQTQASGAAMFWGGAAVGRFGAGDFPFSQDAHSHPIAMQGGNEAHNNMPPFVALLFCEKN